MPNFRKKSLSLATAIAGVLTFGSMMGCSGTDNDDPSSEALSPPSVEVSNGTVVGRWNSQSAAVKLRTFKGIPYAEAPVGDLRFAAPEPKVWSGTLDASEFGSGCPQKASDYGVASTNEDCLYLNVYAPVEPTGEDTYPVMVWIHGGANIYGSGGADYNPENLVKQGVIVVTLNYRLGALGFLAHPAIRDANGDSGNYGIMDQQLALEWVQENIAAFGGNPDNVTLMGESAGGHSVMTHLVAPSSDALFDKAIVQSGAYVGNQINQGTAEYLGAGFTAAPISPAVTPTAQDPEGNGGVGCTQSDAAAQLACLRALPVSTILDYQSASGYIPNTANVPGDATHLLPRSINAALAADEYNEKPILAGSNLNEGMLFLLVDGYTFTQNDYRAKVAKHFATNPTLDTVQIADDYIERALIPYNGFGLIDYDDVAALPSTSALAGLKAGIFNYAYAAMYTDEFFACPSMNQLDTLAANNSNDVYAYLFADQQAYQKYSQYQAIRNFLTGGLLAAHATELTYLLTSTSTQTLRGHIAAQRTLSDAMVQYWASFAKTGVPSGTNTAVTPNVAYTSWGTFNEDDFVISLNDVDGAILNNADNAPPVSNTANDIPISGIRAKTRDEFRSIHNCDYWAAPPTLDDDA